ncbi:MAG: right-handed parallel beta-helix repeat-containing protein [Flavobacteriales bacterium]|nr:right-handed parallel beta-helix repeat-containing protein [Flavobacteriales bacterium]
MKNFMFILFAVYFLSSFCNAQTVIRDKEKVSGVWSEKGAPYIIEGEAIVDFNSTLIIKPGTVITFKTGENRDYTSPDFDLGFLRVNGVINASGNKQKPIIFTRAGKNGYWGVVQIHSAQKGNILKHCKFEYGYYIRNIVNNDNATGVVSVYESAPEIVDCIMAKNGWTGINCKKGSSPLILNNTVVLNSYGIECNTESSPKIINNIVWGNESDNFYVNGGSIPLISYSLIGDLYFPEGAIDNGNNLMNLSPKFDNISNFRLQSDSPCVKAGKKKRNMGANF